LRRRRVTGRRNRLERLLLPCTGWAGYRCKQHRSR
jgi:hypothetical protein